MNNKLSLHELALKHGTDKSFHGFCLFYQSILPSKINKLLEIGVHRGASLKMWADYYPDAKIFGGEFDRNNFYNDDRITTLEVNQEFKASLENLIQQVGYCDVIIDDGGHTMLQQQNTIQVMLPHCKYLVVEDLHTSLYTGYKGKAYGVGSTKQTTLDYIKSLQGVKSVRIFEHYHDNDLSITAVIENV